MVTSYVHTSTGVLWSYLSVQKVDLIFSNYLFCFSEFGDKGYSIEKAFDCTEDLRCTFGYVKSGVHVRVSHGSTGRKKTLTTEVVHKV